MNVEALVHAYEDFTKHSADLTETARTVFPGGDTRASAHFAPYPVFVERGEGCRLYDADGHEYVDFMNNFTSLIHGHGHPAVVAAVTEQVKTGSAYAAPTRSQVALAERLCADVPSLERMRFTSSGSEATLMALRCARAYTGRPRILKMEGGYHGSYDLAEVSLVPFPDRCGPIERPASTPIDRSIAASALTDVVVAPFNEPELATALIEEHADELAAVIVEPIQGSMGMLPATREFLAALRDATSRRGIVLVFDEVITLRTTPGGEQLRHGITPDLTAMGKIIGGGLPIGAFGGRAELVDLFSPDQREGVFHASTFSGNALSMAAGAAALGALDAGAYTRINALGDRLRAGYDRAFRSAGIRGQATGAGSLAQLHLTDRELRGPRDAFAGMLEAGSAIAQALHLGLIRRGVFGAARGMHCISTPMTDREVDHAIRALEETLAELRPVIEKERPALLSG